MAPPKRLVWLLWLACALTCAALVPSLGRAQDAALPQRSTRLHDVGMGTLGFVSAFLAHESGHVGANLMMGNVPRLEGLFAVGFIPFFAIAPGIDCREEVCVKRNGDRFAGGRRGKYFIVTGGFNVQHFTNELILTADPNLRAKRAPFRKGMLLFNVFLSWLYASSAWTGLQDPHGDLGGAANTAGINEIALSFALLAPTIVDTYRYFVPSGAHWSAWVARGTKAGFLGINFVF